MRWSEALSYGKLCTFSLTFHLDHYLNCVTDPFKHDVTEIYETFQNITNINSINCLLKLSKQFIEKPFSLDRKNSYKTFSFNFVSLKLSFVNILGYIKVDIIFQRSLLHISIVDFRSGGKKARFHH